jgi:hypothetical protein
MQKEITVSGFAKGMQREIHSNFHDINNILTVAGVKPLLQAHWTDGGIEQMITDCLTLNESVFSSDVCGKDGKGGGTLRPVIIKTSMFVTDILHYVEENFTAGTSRYPLKTIHQYLSIFMFRNNKVGKIKLTNHEDKPRPCDKPRVKWYLIN